jgi:hypothetical protein
MLPIIDNAVRKMTLSAMCRPDDHVPNTNMSRCRELLPLRHHVEEPSRRNVGLHSSRSIYPLMISRFPRRRPLNQPPLRCGELVHGRPTPTYALAWVCPSRTFFKNLGGGELGKVDDCNFTDVVSEKWRACPKFECVFAIFNCLPT